MVKKAAISAACAATAPLFIWACAQAYAERGQIAIGGEVCVLLIPAIVAGFVFING